MAWFTGFYLHKMFSWGFILSRDWRQHLVFLYIVMRSTGYQSVCIKRIIEVSRILCIANSVWSCPHNVSLSVWGDYKVLERGHLNRKVNKQVRPESRVPLKKIINSLERGSRSFHLPFSSSAHTILQYSVETSAWLPREYGSIFL